MTSSDILQLALGIALVLAVIPVGTFLVRAVTIQVEDEEAVSSPTSASSSARSGSRASTSTARSRSLGPTTSGSR